MVRCLPCPYIVGSYISLLTLKTNPNRAVAGQRVACEPNQRCRGRFTCLSDEFTKQDNHKEERVITTGYEMVQILSETPGTVVVDLVVLYGLCS